MIPFNFASGRPPPPNRPPKSSNNMDTDTVVAPTDPMSVTPDHPEQPSIKTLLGTTVGLIDDSQKDRVLSGPDSVLSFSTFHPLTASGRHGSDERRKLSARTLLDNAKRIVIETVGTGETFWRWVPRARGVGSASDEGLFPRIVLLCGQEVMISQEQWDIYKLDPFYDCYVPSDGSQSIISPDKGKKKAPPGSESKSFPSFSSSEGSSKRSHSRSDTEEAIPKAKRQSRRAYVESDAEDEDEVVDIMEEMAAAPSFQEQKRQRKAEMEQHRRDRREKLLSSRFKSPGLVEDMIDLTMEDIEDMLPAASSSKRPMDVDVDEPASKKRRLRRTSPPAKDQPARKTRPHPRETYQERQERARKAREDAFLAELIAAAHGFTQEQARRYYEEGRGASSSQRPNGPPSAGAAAVDDIPDPVPLDEKVRRMREMNQQENSATSRRRQAQEYAERARAEAEEHERLRARENRKAEEARVKAEKTRRRKQRDNPSWAYGPWTPQRALECYRSLSEYFDSMKFSVEDPITFEDVPWPVLCKPGSFKHTDVDWTSVEKFFQELEGRMRHQDYKNLLQTSQRRFHPDRWSSRRLWDGLSEDTRMALEMAQGTVSKAIGCLWEDFKQKR